MVTCQPYQSTFSIDSPSTLFPFIRFLCRKSCVCVCVCVYVFSTFSLCLLEFVLLSAISFFLLSLLSLSTAVLFGSVSSSSSCCCCCCHCCCHGCWPISLHSTAALCILGSVHTGLPTDQQHPIRPKRERAKAPTSIHSFIRSHLCSS